MTTQYVCTELEESLIAFNGQRHYNCANWQEVHIDQPILPDLTKEQANEITSAVLYVMALAFGWSLVIKFISQEIKK